MNRGAMDATRSKFPYRLSGFTTKQTAAPEPVNQKNYFNPFRPLKRTRFVKPKRGVKKQVNDIT